MFLRNTDERSVNGRFSHKYRTRWKESAEIQDRARSPFVSPRGRSRGSFGDRSDGYGDSDVGCRSGQDVFVRGQGFEQPDDLVRAVAATDRHLADDSRLLEPQDRLVHRVPAALQHLGRSVDGEHRQPRQRCQQRGRCAAGAQCSQLVSSLQFEPLHRPDELTGIEAGSVRMPTSLRRSTSPTVVLQANGTTKRGRGGVCVVDCRQALQLAAVHRHTSRRSEIDPVRLSR